MKIQEFIMQNLPERIDSKYRFILLASERAEQLMQGALPRIRSASRKPTQVAMEEVLTNSVEWDYGPAPEPEIDEEELVDGDEVPADAAAEEGEDEA